MDEGSDVYQESLGWIRETRRFGSKLDLSRIRRLLELSGHPERRTEYIHVAGTNGKGSVAAMTASALRACGARVGLYTSPHLEDFRERIVVDGKMIPKEAVAKMGALQRKNVKTMLEEGMEHPTEFEIVTAMAFSYFAEEGCDYVSLEAGLGGRLDATNVITPAICVITTIDFDHTDRLGDTLEKVAYEKAGIVKAGVPVATGVTQDEALSTIKEKADSVGSPLFKVSCAWRADVKWEEKSYSQEGQTIDVFGPSFTYRDVSIPLLGRHQQANAALAIAALEFGRPNRRVRRFALDREAVKHGIATVRWPGRLEIVGRDPLVLLDGAHNPEGMRAAASALSSLPPRRTICVVGMLSDKDYVEASSILAPVCDEAIATAPDDPRALPPELLATELRRHGVKTSIEPDFRTAIDKAMERAEPEDLVAILGSLYLVGAARTYLSSKHGMTRKDAT